MINSQFPIPNSPFPIPNFHPHTRQHPFRVIPRGAGFDDRDRVVGGEGGEEEAGFDLGRGDGEEDGGICWLVGWLVS